MPPEPLTPGDPATITGRCYCGHVAVTARAAPQTVAYCHCADCRRWTGAPVAAFAAFAEGAVTLTPRCDPPLSITPGVARWFCPRCGTPLLARFDYLPEQVYVPLGILDQAAELPPQVHSHAASALPWLHIEDDAERAPGSGREQLGAAKAPS